MFNKRRKSREHSGSRDDIIQETNQHFEYDRKAELKSQYMAGIKSKIKKVKDFFTDFSSDPHDYLLRIGFVATITFGAMALSYVGYKGMTSGPTKAHHIDVNDDGLTDIVIKGATRREIFLQNKDGEYVKTFQKYDNIDKKIEGLQK